MKSLHCLISGRVQGVNFRAWTRSEAQRLGIKGWVRNLDDGRVEVLAQGEEEKLRLLRERLTQGSPFSRVEDVECRYIEYDKTYTSFEVRW